MVVTGVVILWIALIVDVILVVTLRRVVGLLCSVGVLPCVVAVVEDGL